MLLCDREQEVSIGSGFVMILALFLLKVVLLFLRVTIGLTYTISLRDQHTQEEKSSVD